MKEHLYKGKLKKEDWDWFVKSIEEAEHQEPYILMTSTDYKKHIINNEPFI